MTHLQRAIDATGGVSALASAIQVAPSVPSMWKKRGNVPAEHCPAIERATRAIGDPEKIVTCEQLRPDVHWEVLRLQVAQATPEAGAAQ